MQNVDVSVKHKSSGIVTELGKTNADGKVTGEGLSYSEYEVIQTAPDGYICADSSQTVIFTTKNNSLNTVNFTNTKEENSGEPSENTENDNESD